MILQIDAEDEYIVIVNQRQLRKRARRFGFKDVQLIRAEYLLPEECEELKKELFEITKPIVLILFRPDGDRFFDRFLKEEKTAALRLLVIDLYGKKITETETVDSLLGAIGEFPRKEAVECQLSLHGYLQPKKEPICCGRCRNRMRPGDRYCQCCGAPLGEAMFQPAINTNAFVGLYGAPTRRKYKCSSCGHLWITNVLMNDVRHCPQCGLRQIEKMKDNKNRYFGFRSMTGFEEPFEESNRPVLFSAEESRKLLKVREKLKKKYEESGQYEYHNEDVAIDALKEIGFRIPEIKWNEYRQSFTFPRTEKEEEQILLARRIIFANGNDPDWDSRIRCPYCTSSLKAVIDRRVINQNGRELLKHYHTHAPKNAIACEGDLIRTEDNTITTPAYLCLCCGTEYGELCFTKEQKERYEKQDQEN